jgi:hypothetical protein
MGAQKIFQSVLFGLAVIYLIATATSLLFSLLLRYTSLVEDQMNIAMIAVSFIALFFGGFVAGGRGKERGWLLGGLTGLFYTIINFAFQYLGLDAAVTKEQLIYYLCFNLTAVMGGILGVNIASSGMRQT